MAGKRRYVLVLIVLVVGVSMLTASDRSPRARVARRVEPVVREADPYEGRTVLVEAFVVQMDLAALYEMGVNPLGQAPHSVSVANLQEYLRTGDKANVLVGTKAAAIHTSNRNTAKGTETRYYPRTRLINTPQGKKESVEHTPYETAETLSVTPTIVSQGTVAVSYSFTYSGLRTPEGSSDRPLDTVRWSWDGYASLNVGEPRIVGATQDSENAVFFVMTAHILE